MTLTVVCGMGHVNRYNLTTTDSLHKVTALENGDVIKEDWDWSHWKCPLLMCEHREYVSHHIDNTWGEKGAPASNPTLIAGLLLLSMILTIKTRTGI